MSLKRRILISILLGLYLSIATSSMTWDRSVYIFFIVKTIVFIFLLFFIIKYLNKIKIPKYNGKITKKTYVGWFIYIFIVMLLALYIYYPNNYSSDPLTHYQDAIAGIHSDWHPTIYVFLFYGLPTLFIKSKLMCSLFNMLFISFILLYFCKFLEKYGFSKLVITIVLSLFILNPTFDSMTITPIKDTAYSYCIFLLTLYLINIYFTKGEWLKKKLNFIAFLVVCFGLTFFRHNGIGTFILVLIPMIFIFKNIRKFSILVFTIIISLRFIFIPVIYKLCGIDKVTFNFSESTALLFHQISYIYNNDGVITSKQLKTLQKMQDLKTLSEYYDPYNYNTTKYAMPNYGKYTKYIESHKKEFLNLWYELVSNNKKLAVKSYFYHTYCIWHIDINVAKVLDEYYKQIHSANLDRTDALYKVLSNIYLQYQHWFCLVPFIFITVGSGLFLILFSLLYSFFKVKDKLKMTLIYLPVFSNLLIMLVMIPSKESRFVYSNLICAFPLIIFIFLLNNRKNIKASL